MHMIFVGKVLYQKTLKMNPIIRLDFHCYALNLSVWLGLHYNLY